MAKTQDYYKILQISPTAEIKEIKAAYRRLARQYHPDLNRDPNAADKFKQIQTAYETLVNENKRNRYDRRSQSRNSNNSRDFTPQAYVEKGESLASRKEYYEAIANFNRAIELDNNFLEAYLKRAEIRYMINDDRGVLEDCICAIALSPISAPAYYYQGRSRYRLGYTQSSIEAYSQAIRYEPQYAQAYYRRGIAYRDLKQWRPAVADFEYAMTLLQQQGNRKGARLAQSEAQKIQQQLFGWRIHLLAFLQLWSNAIAGMMHCGFNPSGGIVNSYSRLRSNQAAGVGIIYAAIASVGITLGIYWQIPEGVNASLAALIVSSFFPFTVVAAVSSIFRSLFSGSGRWQGDVYIAGAALIPSSLVALLYGITASEINPIVVTIIMIIAFCNTVLLLYGGCTGISNLPQGVSAIAVQTIILLTGMISFSIFAPLF